MTALLITLVIAGTLGWSFGGVLHYLFSPRGQVPWNWRLLHPRYSLYVAWRDEHHPDWWKS